MHLVVKVLLVLLSLSLISIVIHMCRKPDALPTEGFENMDMGGETDTHYNNSNNTNDASAVYLPDPPVGRQLSAYTHDPYADTTVPTPTPTPDAYPHVNSDDDGVSECSDEEAGPSAEYGMESETDDDDDEPEPGPGPLAATPGCSVTHPNTPIIPYGYTYFPHTSWSVPQKRPPVCTPRAQPVVVPTYTSGVPESALEIQSSTNQYNPPTTYSSNNTIPKETRIANSYYPGYSSTISE